MNDNIFSLKVNNRHLINNRLIRRSEFFLKLFAIFPFMYYICRSDEIKEESKGYLWESIGLYCRH